MSGQNRKQRTAIFLLRGPGVNTRRSILEQKKGKPATRTVLATGHEQIALKTEAVEPTPLEIDVQHAVADELPTVEQDFDDFHRLNCSDDRWR